MAGAFFPLSDSKRQSDQDRDGENGAAIRDRLRAGGSGPGTVVIAGPQDVADRRHSLVQDGKIDCEGAAASPSGILGSPSENGDLRRGHIGSWRFTDDERIEDIVRCRSYDGIYSPFLTPHRRTFWAGRDTGRYPITEEAPQINGAGVGYTGYPVRRRKKI